MMASKTGLESILVFGCFLIFITLANGNYLERTGCHRVGHTRKISIPDCVEFSITTNACRGFCPSYATPSPNWVLKSNSRQQVWSVSQCCNIMETEDVPVEVLCLEGYRKLTFKSAKACSCYICHKQ